MSFQPTGQGLDIFNDRYARYDGEGWKEASQRLAQAMSAAERPEVMIQTEYSFFRMIDDGLFMPGGRIWYGAGRPKQAMLNCFVIPTEDSIDGWAKTVGDLMKITSAGGGVGMNLSPIRGRGFPKSSGGESSGAVSLGVACNGVGDVLRGGGGRRIAMMQALDVDHPDIEEFISAKLDRNELTNANVSLMIPPHMKTEWFVDRVLDGKNLELRFGGKGHGKINLAELWEKVIFNAWKSGEPGVLNGYLANQQSNVYYSHPLVCTNPCGEIWLPAYGCCCLGALVLPRFVKDGNVDWRKLAETIKTGVRFLDNVLTVNDYPLPEIQQMCQKERRIGLGVMGLHSMLMDLGMKYDSSAAYTFVDELMSFIKEEAYVASIQLAKEKGAFPAYDPAFLQSKFVKTLDPMLRALIRRHGIRNCAMLTIAPTGTTSEVHDVTGGIETMFAPVYRRRRWKDGDIQHEDLVFSGDYMDNPDVAQGAYDVSPYHHLSMQAVVQKHIDNAVSKTINLPEDYPVERLGSDLLHFLPVIKGSTFYRDGSRENEPFKYVPADKVAETELEFITAGKPVEVAGNYVQDCVTGVCEL